MGSRMQGMAIQQFFRFAAFGVLGFGVDAGTLLVARSLFGMNLYGARVMSFLAAVTTTWALNRRFTFRRTSLAHFSEWLRFMAFNAVGGLVNFGTYVWMVHELAMVRDVPVIGVAAGSVAGLFVNFTLTKMFVFVNRDERGRAIRKT